MSDRLAKASFTFCVTNAEAEVLRQVDDALAIVNDASLTSAERTRRFEALGDAFADCFPPSRVDVFDGFRAIFSDRSHPRLGFALQIDPPGNSDVTGVLIHGDEVDVEAAVSLIRAVTKAPLPFGLDDAPAADDARVGFAVHGLVLAMRDTESGLLFWNRDAGFGPLEAATVFSEAEAANCDIPVADDQPEWLALPRPIT